MYMYFRKIAIQNSFSANEHKFYVFESAVIEVGLWLKVTR